MTKAKATLDGELVRVDRLDQQQDTIRMPMLDNRVPDADWEHVDSRGHFHAWAGSSLPTLEADYSAPSWCDLCNEVHETLVGYLCRICRGVVQPQWVTGPPVVTIPGPVSWRIGLTVSKPLPMQGAYSLRVERDDGGVLFGIVRPISMSSAEGSVWSVDFHGEMHMKGARE